MTNKIPNFFIVGAPKCGTTALSRYLGEHPNIFMSSPKEPYYFADDFPDMKKVLSGIDTYEKYVDIFRDVGKEHLAVGEASTNYLFSSSALRNVHHFNPEARIIVMVRNPVELVQSFHSQILGFLNEDEKDFETAWRLQDSRKSGQNLPRNCLDAKLLQYAEWGKLGEQVERLFDVFDPGQVKVIVFDDLIANTRIIFDDVLSFLQVPSDNRVQFPRVNANARYRFPKLALRLLKLRRSLWYKRMAEKIKAVVNIHPYRWFSQIHRVQVKRQSISDELGSELVAEFRDDVKKLSNLIDVNLDHWME